MLFDAASKAPPEAMGLDGTDVAGELLDTRVTEGKGTVLDVTVLRVPLCGDASPLEAEADGLDELGWRTDVVKRVTMAGGTEDIAGLGAKLGC